jgi:hypothetical protein
LLKDAPESFKNNALVNEFISKAHENAKLMIEQQRMEQNEATRGQQQSQLGAPSSNGAPQGGMQMPQQGAQQGQ